MSQMLNHRNLCIEATQEMSRHCSFQKASHCNTSLFRTAGNPHNTGKKKSYKVQGRHANESFQRHTNHIQLYLQIKFVLERETTHREKHMLTTTVNLCIRQVCVIMSVESPTTENMYIISLYTLKQNNLFLEQERSRITC